MTTATHRRAGTGTIADDPAVAEFLAELGRIEEQERDLKLRQRELPATIASLESSPTSLTDADELLARKRELEELPLRLSTVASVREGVEKRLETALRAARDAVREDALPDRLAALQRFWASLDGLVAAASEVGRLNSEVIERCKVGRRPVPSDGFGTWRGNLERGLRELRRSAGPRPTSAVE